MKLAALTNKSLRSQIDFGEGEILNFTYNPAAFTPRFFETITHEDGKNRARDLAVFINALVTEWDLTDDGGIVYPLDVESLCALPLEFLDRVVGQVNEDSNPNRSKPAPSGSF